MADCAANQVCAAAPDPAFDSALCIWRNGDNQCPEGPYTQRTVRYAGFADDRTCETCTCGDPAGSCAGTVTFTDGCGALPQHIATVGVGECQEVTGAGAATYNPEPDASCMPSTGAVLNTAAETNPVTICCTP